MPLALQLEVGSEAPLLSPKPATKACLASSGLRPSRCTRHPAHGSHEERQKRRGSRVAGICCACGGERDAMRLEVAGAAASLLLAASAALIPLPCAALELEALERVTEATSDLRERVQDKLQALSPGASKEPENVFERLLPSHIREKPDEKDRRDKEREREREYKQREKEEKQKQEKIRQEQERIKKERDKLFKQQAIIGGSALGIGALFIGKWQAIAAGTAILFRTLGGPTIMSNVLRTPGLLFGRSLRVVEWDVAKSPHVPNGRVVSFKLRALTPVGLRQAIVKNCGLSDAREVKQMCHWIQCGPGFYEPLTSVPAFRMLDNPSWIVWSRRPRKGFDAIPYRVDEHEIALREQDPFGTLMPQQELELMIRTINAAAALSRGERPSPIQRIGHQGHEEASSRFDALFDGASANAPSSSPSQNGVSSHHDGKDGRSHASNGNGAAPSHGPRTARESAEKKGNQAAMAAMRRAEGDTPPVAGSSNGCDGASADPSPASSALDTWGRQSRASLTSVTQPVQQIGHCVGEAMADPVAATRDALGVPTSDCQPSTTAEPSRSNTPGPSTGGQGAELRETPAQLDRYKVAAASLEELLTQSARPGLLPPISQEEEDRLVAAAVASKEGENGLRGLFRIYASDDVGSFLRFGRALVAARD